MLRSGAHTANSRSAEIQAALHSNVAVEICVDSAIYNKVLPISCLNIGAHLDNSKKKVAL